MRILHAMVKSATLVAIALAADALVATAQEPMTFRPLSADSLAALQARAAVPEAKGAREHPVPRSRTCRQRGPL